MDSHLSGFQLLRVASGQPIEASLARHAEACPACRAELARLRQEQAAMDAFLHPEARVAELRAALAGRSGRRPARRGLVPAVSVAAAALLALLVVPRFVSEPEPSPGTRLKGGFEVAVHLQRDGAVTLTTADRVPARSGDRVRLGVRAPRAGFATVAALVDGAFVPIGELTAVPVAGGSETVLPGSLALECAGPFETLRVSWAAAEDVAAGPEPSTTILFVCER
jgi:hypothetical protein